MNKFYYLFLLISISIMGQQTPNKSDYFMQFNMQNISKKVNTNELLSHKIFNDFNKTNEYFKLNDFVTFVDQKQPIVINGKFTDSTTFNQITFSIVDEKKVTAFIQKKINEDQEYYDTIPTIKKKGDFQIFTPTYSDFSLGWNKNNLVIYQIIENNPTPYYNYSIEQTEDAAYYDEENIDTVAVAVEDFEAVEAVEAVAIEAPAELDPKTNAAKGALDAMGIVINEEDDYYAEEVSDDNSEQERKAKQETQLIALFENGFQVPYSEKINTKADIASWVDYQAFSGKLSDLYKVFKTIAPKTILPVYDHTIIGMNFDFYFENDKAKMEQVVEYSPALGAIMEKVANRKPSKNFISLFPNEAPLAYMSYHANMKELLVHYPEISEQLFSALPVEKQDMELITDLFSTLIDEEATATLFDGDLAMFLHGIEKFDYTYKTKSFDDDYNVVEDEKTIEKTRAVFTMLLTSSHEKMATKLLELGVRKNILVKENNHYIFKEDTDLGKFTFFKQGDVVVFTNGLQHLNTAGTSDFGKKMKKELANNYLVGNIDVQRFMKNILLNQDFGKDTEKMIKLSNQFKNMEFKSSKKVEDNKMKLEMNMNSNFSNKNIITQTLDLIDFLN